MAQLPPDLEHAPPQWKQAFRALKDYAVATGLRDVFVTATKPDGTVTPVQVDLEPTAEGIIVRITLP